jgi:SAM-dependent methyltransferase
VLDIGYGSGIFFPELTRRADVVFGIDIHPHGARARSELSDCGVEATLAQGDAMALPFRDGSFDAVVCVSTLEFVSDPALVLTEAHRVTRPGGVVLAISPRPVAWADRVYSALVGFDPESDFRGGRTRVQRALDTVALPLERRPRPRGLPRALVPYELLVIKRSESDDTATRPRLTREIAVRIPISTEPSSEVASR